MNLLTELEQFFKWEYLFVFKASKEQQISILEVALKNILNRFYDLLRVTSLSMSVNNKVLWLIQRYFHDFPVNIPILDITNTKWTDNFPDFLGLATR